MSVVSIINNKSSTDTYSRNSRNCKYVFRLTTKWQHMPVVSHYHQPALSNFLSNLYTFICCYLVWTQSRHIAKLSLAMFWILNKEILNPYNFYVNFASILYVCALTKYNRQKSTTHKGKHTFKLHNSAVVMTPANHGHTWDWEAFKRDFASGAAIKAMQYVTL